MLEGMGLMDLAQDKDLRCGNVNTVKVKSDDRHGGWFIEKLQDSSLLKKKPQDIFNGKSACARTHTHTHTHTQSLYIYGMLYAPALTALSEVSIYLNTVLCEYIHTSVSLDHILYLVHCKILEDTNLK